MTEMPNLPDDSVWAYFKSGIFPTWNLLSVVFNLAAMVINFHAPWSLVSAFVAGLSASALVFDYFVFVFQKSSEWWRDMYMWRDQSIKDAGL